jgi:hypothetical protein
MITDEELVSAYLAGNASALDTLLERYQARIWEYIRSSGEFGGQHT